MNPQSSKMGGGVVSGGGGGVDLLEYAIFSSNQVVNESVNHEGISISLESGGVCVVEIDRNILAKQRICLADFHTNDELVRSSGCDQFPQPTVRMVYAMQKAVYDCELLGEEDEVEGGEDDEGEEVAEGGKKKMKKKQKEVKTKKRPVRQTKFTHNGNCYERVQEYVETVYDKDNQSVLGWRLYYVALDESFNMDMALASQFSWNQRQVLKVVESTTSQLYVKDMEDWVTRVMTYYPMSPEIRSTYDPINPSVQLFYPLMHPLNTAACSKIFNPLTVFESSIFAGRCDPVYLQVWRYARDGKIVFPRGAISVCEADRHPDFFHHVVLLENSMTRAPLLRFTGKHVLKLIQEKRDRVKMTKRLYSGEGNVLNQVKEANENELKDIMARQKELECKLREEGDDEHGTLKRELVEEKKRVARKIHEWRYRKETVERMNIVLTSPDALSPGLGACVRWLISQKNKAAKEGKKWSAMRLDHTSLDPTLNVFSRFIARDMYIFEHVFAVATLQSELLLYMINRLNSTDLRRERLKQNMVLLGPHAAGKSVISKHMKAASVPGWSCDVTYETDKAYATNVNKDQQALLHDELHERYLQEGEGNQGSSIIKAVLTEKEIVTNTIDPETRETKQFVAHLDINMFANSNATKERFPAPLASRMILVPVYRYIRKNYDMTLKDAELSHDVRDHHLYESVCDEYRLLQVLVCCIDMHIYAGVLPQVDMTAANLLLAEVTSQLMQHAIYVEPRQKTQLENGIRCCTMMEAVRRTWFTREVFQDSDKEFESVDVLEVLPYLYATEQHVIFTLTHMKDVLVDNIREKVVQALVHIAYGNKDKVLSYHVVGKTETNADMVDYNYYFISGNAGHGTSERILAQLAVKVNTVLKANYNMVLNVSEITSVLHSMSGEQYTSEYSYNAENKPMEKVAAENHVVLKVDTVPGRIGVAVSRMYLEKSRVVDRSIILTVLEKLQTKYTPNRKLITGCTFRSADYMYPYLLEVMTQSPKPGVSSVAKNLAYRAVGFGECLGGKRRMNEYDAAYLELDCSIEEYYYRKFLETHQIDTPPVNFPVDNPQLSPEEKLDPVDHEHHEYPLWYVEDHKKTVASGQNRVKVGSASETMEDMLDRIETEFKATSEEGTMGRKKPRIEQEMSEEVY